MHQKLLISLSLSFVLGAPAASLPSKVALTFDDSPTPATAAIVSTLAAHSTVATFFVVGQQVERWVSVLQTALQNGCEIGNHTWSHADLSSLSFAEISTEFALTDEVCKKHFGFRPQYVRIPYNHLGLIIPRDIEKMGYRIVRWDIDDRDWENPAGALSVITTALVKRHLPAIILLHDRRATINFLPQLLNWLAEQKIRCVTAEEILAERQNKQTTAPN